MALPLQRDEGEGEEGDDRAKAGCEKQLLSLSLFLCLRWESCTGMTSDAPYWLLKVQQKKRPCRMTQKKQCFVFTPEWEEKYVQIYIIIGGSCDELFYLKTSDNVDL